MSANTCPHRASNLCVAQRKMRLVATALVVLFGGVAGERVAGATAAAGSASTDEVSTKEAFDAAKELATVDGWNAFLARHPEGFLSDLAKAYVQKLSGSDAATIPDKPPAASSTAAAPTAESTPVSARPAVMPAIDRGAQFMGFPEKFNRYYTDPSWLPLKVIYVSPTGGGDGSSREAAMQVKDAVAAARPGTQITFTSGKYQGCFEFTKENSGTYEDPVVLYAEPGEGDQPIGVELTCCDGGRQTCFNLEAADYVAIDGFELVGGKYGVRTIGAGYAASEHARGIAVIGCKGHDQDKDPFFSGAVDWAVWEGNIAYGAKKGDGHGFYLSNGGDWNIVRFNETFSNTRSDFQINPDPASTCAEPGIPFNDPRCDAYAGEGEGGQGASDYFLVDSNYFHHTQTNGPNFTSTRRSIIRNNVFGPQGTHNVSFWQETDNPKLGASDNKILHNLFITTGRHGVKFEANSTRNEFANNVLVGVKLDGGSATANPAALLMEVDGSVGDNVYRSNLYVSGKLEGREPNGEETVRADFFAGWFAKFPAALSHEPNDFKPTAQAPFLGKGKALPDAPVDRNGVNRKGTADLGPIEGG